MMRSETNPERAPDAMAVDPPNAYGEGDIVTGTSGRCVNLHSSSLSALLIASAAIGFCAPAHADDSGLLNDTFNISLGTFLLSTNTTVKVDGTAGQQGSDVNLGRDLGFSDSNRFRVDATWRFFKRHKLRFMYFSNDTHADRSISRDITIGDTTYPTSASLHSSNKTTIAELAYEYVFMQRDTFELSGSVGVHSVKFELGVSGDGTVGGQTGQFSTETASATAPLPVIGLRGLWEFSPQWYFDGQAQYFGLKIDNVDGHLTDLRVGVTRMFGSHFGVGLGWNQFATKVNLTKDSFEGSLKWRYSGAMLYITGAF
jgi:hypothetical protein